MKMVFLGDIAFYLVTLVFAVGIYMIHHANHHDSGKPCKLLRAGGYIVTVISILGALCTGYYWLKYFSQGAFDKPHPQKQSMMMGKGGMIGGQGMKMMKNSMDVNHCMNHIEGKVMDQEMMKNMKSCLSKQYGQEQKLDSGK
jgi:hypothetical protein